MSYTSFSNLPLSAYNELSSKVEDRVYFINDEGTIRLNEVTYGAGGGGGVDNTDYLTFTAEQANSTISLNKSADDPSLSAVLEYSTDGKTWTNYEWSGTSGFVITLANVGDYVKFRGNNETFSFYTVFYTFAMTGGIFASGNIMSLLDKTCSLISISTQCCFRSLFNGCSKLTHIPSLPAIKLNNNCYQDMFNGCTGLSQVDLLSENTILAPYCCIGMFGRCTGLVKANILPPNLKNNCYERIFVGCSKLTRLSVNFLNWEDGWFGPNNPEWVNVVAASGTFYCPYGLDTSIRDISHIPVGWDVIYTDVPESVISGAAAAAEALTMINS